MTAPTPDALLASLRAAYTGRLLTAADDTEPYLTDFRRRWSGPALAVAQPASTNEVATLVRWCSQHRVALVPQGGNTGLVGGGVPRPEGPSLLLSLQRMNRVLAVDPLNNTLTAQGGCVLAQVQAAAQAAGRLFPLSLGAEGSCTLGGNLATNAGGIQVLRYGNARDLCLGLEVVLADGTVWNGLRGLRKDNTGYDLKQFFIGSEGTLGIITAATVKLYPQPAAQVTALAALPDADSALRLLELAQQRLGASLTAFELMSGACLELLTRHMPQCRNPLAGEAPFCVLLESSDPESEAHATEAFNRLMEAALEAGCITNAAVATSLAQTQAFWTLRHSLTEAQAREGENLKHDISLPISAIPAFLAQSQADILREHPSHRILVFGHVGDGNLHYNVSPRRDASAEEYRVFRQQEKALSRRVYETVHRLGGSISAEHGVGQLRVHDNEHFKSAAEMALMRRIKAALDPDNLLNPGRVLAL